MLHYFTDTYREVAKRLKPRRYSDRRRWLVHQPERPIIAFNRNGQCRAGIEVSDRDTIDQMIGRAIIAGQRDAGDQFGIAQDRDAAGRSSGAGNGEVEFGIR